MGLGQQPQHCTDQLVAESPGTAGWVRPAATLGAIIKHKGHARHAQGPETVKLQQSRYQPSFCFCKAASKMSGSTTEPPYQHSNSSELAAKARASPLIPSAVTITWRKTPQDRSQTAGMVQHKLRRASTTQAQVSSDAMLAFRPNSTFNHKSRLRACFARSLGSLPLAARLGRLQACRATKLSRNNTSRSTIMVELPPD